ncbi:hypothetical protein HON22_01490, partial [Candidatus Peregrinibacteria bacterium]|nr:hypothetical protein [Candidatus Peregrinibacteria bacterium]
MKTKKILFGLFAILLTLGGILGIYGSTYFKAALLDGGATNAQGADLYISDSYTALSADSGNIEVRTSNGLPNIAAVSFTLTYNPEQIHILSEHTLGTMEDSQGAAVTPQLVSVTPDNANGKTVIDIANADSFNVPVNSLLISLPIKIQDNIPEGTEISLIFSSTELIDGNFNFLSAKASSGTIQVQSGAAEGLSVLQSQAVSENEIEVYFNDFLTDSSQVSVETTRNIKGSTISNEIDFESVKISSDNGKKLMLQTQFLRDINGVALTQFQTSDTNAEIVLKKNAILSKTQIDVGVGANNIIQILPKNTALSVAGTNNAQLKEDVSINNQMFLKGSTVSVSTDNNVTVPSTTIIKEIQSLSAGSLLEFTQNPFNNLLAGNYELRVPSETKIQDTHQLGATNTPELVSETAVNVALEIKLQNDTLVNIGSTQLNVLAGTSITLPSDALNLNDFLAANSQNPGAHQTQQEYPIQFDNNGATNNATLPASTDISVTFETTLVSTAQVSFLQALSTDTNILFPENTTLNFNVNNSQVSLQTNEPVRNALEDGTTYKIHFISGPSGNIKTTLAPEESTTYFALPSASSGDVSINCAINVGPKTI